MERLSGKFCIITGAARGIGKAIAEAAEVAAVAVLLASDEVAYITGTEMTIDGGILAGSAAAPGS